MPDPQGPRPPQGAYPQYPQAQPQQGAAGKDAPAPQPTVKGFRILARRTGVPSALIQELSMLSFLKIVQDANDPETVIALNVEGRDIQKNPYLFTLLYFRPQTIDVLYTLLPGSSPRKRKLDVIKNALNVLTMTSNTYRVDIKYLFQMVEGAISDMNEYVASDFDKLFSSYDSLKSEADLLKKRSKEIGDAHTVLSKENYDLKVKNDELTLKLRALETYSDSVLGMKIQEWVSEHNGEMNLAEFSRVHSVPETRVEQLLNKMVSEGYLETRK